MTTHSKLHDPTARPGVRLPPAAALAAALAALACAGPRAGAGSPLTAPAPAAVARKAPAPVAPPPATASAAKRPAARSPYAPDRFAGRAGAYYRHVWGVEALSVKLVESGELVRFAWRVIDPVKASVLNDRSLQPALEDARAGVSLVVPAMEKVGPLRQGQPPEAGHSYWMAFSNKGRPVRRGDRVSVVVGTFRAEGLVVD